MRSRLLLACTVIAITGCAGGSGRTGAYDPDAKETKGRVLERRDTGATARQQGRGTLIPAGALLVPISLYPGSPDLPIYEHRIALEDGRTIVVFSTYPHHPVGGCVKVFESPRPDYPRLINDGGCKS